MATTYTNTTGAAGYQGLHKVYTWTYTHDFSKVSCLGADTIQVLLPANVMVLAGAYQVVTAGTTVNVAIGVTGNTDYVAATAALGTAGTMITASDIATPQILAGATNYLIFDPDTTTAASGVIKVTLALADFN